MKSLKLIFVLCLICGLVVVIHEWIAARRDAQALKQTIAAQNRVVTAADAAKRQNDSNLQKALQQIEALKRTVRTPAAAVQGLNQSLPLPAPIVFSSADSSRASNWANERSDVQSTPTQSLTESGSASLPSRPNSKLASRGDVGVVPAVDLLPLYRYTQDCRACGAELDAAKLNALSDAKKIAALLVERDETARMSRNGSFKYRVKDAAIWFAVGLVVGFVGVENPARRQRSALTREN